MTRRGRWTTPTAILIGLAVSASGCGTTSPTPPTSDASPTPTINRSATYVALGDSYTSHPGTNTQASVVCERSTQNYPHLVAKALKYTLTDMSCGGAKIADLTSSQKTGAAPQFDALSSKTRLVTVSIGGNDHGFSTVLLGSCYYVKDEPAAKKNPCEMRSLIPLLAGLKTFPSELTKAYRAIRAKAPNARVIVIGYPQILGDAGTCAKYPIASGDVAYVNAVNTQVNAAMQTAAKAAGVEYLDVATASAGHGVCSKDPWIAGLKRVPGKASAVHPFGNEQQAVAALLEAKLKG